MNEKPAPALSIVTQRIESVGLAIAISMAFIFSFTYLRQPSSSENLTSSVVTADYQIDLATASQAELQLIPGFGEVLASRWIEQRAALMQEHPNPVEAMSAMEGIGPAKLALLMPYIAASSPDSDRSHTDHR